MRLVVLLGLSLLLVGCAELEQFGLTGLFVGVDAVEPIEVDVVKVLSWNIENLGKSKASSDRMDLIADVVDGFDIIAIQEVSNVHERSDSGCSRNVDSCPGHANCGLIEDAFDSRLDDWYKIVISDQVKDERYMYIYDSRKVSLVDEFVVLDVEMGELCDPTEIGRMARQPYVGRFLVGEKEFTLMQTHTSPSRNVEELEALYEFYNSVEGLNKIVLGDLNADCSYLREKDDIGLRSLDWALDLDTTIAKSDCTYDQFAFLDVGYVSSGVVRFDLENGMTLEEADRISDHYPVWASFSVN